MFAPLSRWLTTVSLPTLTACVVPYKPVAVPRPAASPEPHAVSGTGDLRVGLSSVSENTRLRFDGRGRAELRDAFFVGGRFQLGINNDRDTFAQLRAVGGIPVGLQGDGWEIQPIGVQRASVVHHSGNERLEITAADPEIGVAGQVHWNRARFWSEVTQPINRSGNHRFDDAVRLWVGASMTAGDFSAGITFKSPNGIDEAFRAELDLAYSTFHVQIETKDIAHPDVRDDLGLFMGITLKF